MGKIGRWFANFMRGRNGLDYFGYVLSWIYLALMIIQIIVGMFSATASFIMSVFMWMLFFYMMFRIFSKNIRARSRENAAFTKFWVKTPFGKKNAGKFDRFGGYNGYNYNNYNNYNDYADYTDRTRETKETKKKKNKKQKLPRDKDHVYRTCPECKANIRLPKKKGAHSVRCPRCSTLFDVKI